MFGVFTALFPLSHHRLVNDPCVLFFFFFFTSVGGSFSGANYGRVGLSEFIRGLKPIPCNCVRMLKIYAVGGLGVFFYRATSKQTVQSQKYTCPGSEKCLGCCSCFSQSFRMFMYVALTVRTFSLVQLVQGYAPVFVFISLFVKGRFAAVVL